MNCPEILLLPILMFTDYFLTVTSRILMDKKYSQHFVVEHYELNPIWQKQVAEKRWVNIRHILLTLLIPALLSVCIELFDAPDTFVQGTLGALFAFFAAIVARHISNILIFHHVIRNPQELSGRVTMAHSLALFLSMYQYTITLLPMVMIAIFAQSPFTYGAVVGAMMLFLVHCIWIRNYKKTLNTSNKSIEGTG